MIRIFLHTLGGLGVKLAIMIAATAGGSGQWMEGAGVLAVLFGIYALMGWSHLALLEGWFGKHGESY